MNDQLQVQLANLISSITTSANEAKGFILSELPDVVHQILTWYFTINLIYFIAALAGFTFVIYIIYISVTACKHRRQTAGALHRFISCYRDNGTFYDIHPSALALWLPAFTVFIISCMKINLIWLQILIAPKLWLIEYATHLIK